MGFRRTFAPGAFVAVLAAAPAARGQDAGTADGGLPPDVVLAAYCGEAQMQCTIAPLAYEKTVELPIAFDWDTDWIPKGSDLQVRFFVELPAETTVKLSGYLQTEWPDAMTLSTPGPARLGGLLSFDYGLQVGAKARFDISGYSWEGDIPFVPQVDFHLAAARSFDSWAFAPESATASAVSPRVELFALSVTSLVGIPSIVADGGVALDVRGELEATYSTYRIRIDPALPGEPPVRSADGTTPRSFVGGGSVEYDVWPEGAVFFTGTLDLIPTFYLELFGLGKFRIPITTYPYSVPIGEVELVFDPVRVHVPLPDVEPVEAVVDFGDVVVGERAARTLSLDNVGEAQARAFAEVDGTVQDDWVVLTKWVLVDPSASGDVDLRFSPTAAGPYETTLTVSTNDPDLPVQTVTLRGHGVSQDAPTYPDGGVGGTVAAGGSGGATAPAGGAAGLGDIPAVRLRSQAGDSGGCGCRTASRGRGLPLGLALPLLGGGAWIVRRRRRRAGRRPGRRR